MSLDLDDFCETQTLGGPLAFLLMMKRLQADSIVVIDTLKMKLKSLRIDEYQGENISNLVSHIRSICNRLRTLEKRDDEGKVIEPTIPTDIGKTLIKLFQTSSDKKFNDLFQLKELNAFEKALTEGDKAYGSIDDILNYAHLVYTNITASKEGWTGQFHKANESGFNAINTN